jgi:hypothetical protein
MLEKNAAYEIMFSSFFDELGAIEKEAMEKDAFIGALGRMGGTLRSLKGAVAGGLKTAPAAGATTGQTIATKARGVMSGLRDFGAGQGRQIRGAFARGAAGAPVEAGRFGTAMHGVGNVLKNTGAGNLAVAGGIGAAGIGGVSALSGGSRPQPQSGPRVRMSFQRVS